MQPLYSNAIQSCVVQHHYGVGIERETLEGEQGVVGLDHHVTGLILVGKDTAQAGRHCNITDEFLQSVEGQRDSRAG